MGGSRGTNVHFKTPVFPIFSQMKLGFQSLPLSPRDDGVAVKR